MNRSKQEEDPKKKVQKTPQCCECRKKSSIHNPVQVYRRRLGTPKEKGERQKVEKVNLCNSCATEWNGFIL